VRSRSPKLIRAAIKRRKQQQRVLHLAVHATTGGRPERYLRRYLFKAHQILRPPLHSMSLALVGDATMTKLHKQYLGIAGPTDVLTFELDHDDRGRVTAGEVVVCVPEARRRAKKLGSTVERELLLYALHGMLHLAGFDDRTAAGFRQMHRREDDILTRLGVGPVFAPQGAGRRAAARTGGR
jgi:probable rRNA maturation factor